MCEDIMLHKISSLPDHRLYNSLTELKTVVEMGGHGSSCYCGLTYEHRAANLQTVTVVNLMLGVLYYNKRFEEKN